MKSSYQDNCTLVKKGMDFCCEKLRDHATIPAVGPFSAMRVHFSFRGSKNEAYFQIEHQSGNIRWLRFMAMRPGYDMVVSHYMKKGTNEELITYLSDESNVPEFANDFQGLSNSLDDKLD